MRADYPQWLVERKYADDTQTAQISRVKKVEQNYGNLDDHYANGTYQEIIDSLQYSTGDERANKPNPSKIKLGNNANIRKNLQSYKNAVELYREFLNDSGFEGGAARSPESPKNDDAPTVSEDNQQRLSLERDMQAALRRNIPCLDAPRWIPAFAGMTCENWVKSLAFPSLGTVFAMISALNSAG